MNSSDFEFSPIMDKDSAVWFIRKGKSTGKEYKIFRRASNRDIPYSVSPELKNITNYGPICFVGDNKIITSRNAEGKNKQSRHLSLFESSFNGKELVNFIQLSVNSPGSDACHPTTSPDGNILIFASNRSEGYGGMDLYMSVNENEQWLTPINLGPSINTSANETFPFLDDRGILFFTSDGPHGQGGADIYFTYNCGMKWASPVPLPVPINSKADDFGLTFQSGNDHGLFSSNRKEGKGKDDIYSFQYSSEIPATATSGLQVLKQNKKQIADRTIIVLSSNVALSDVSLMFLQAKDMPNNVISDYKPGDPIPALFQNKSTRQKTDATGKKIIPAHKEDILVAVYKEGFAPVIIRIAKEDSRSTIVVELQPESPCVQTKGVVTDLLHQTPVNNAWIQVVDKYSQTILEELQSDALGQYKLCLKCGVAYQIKISAEKMQEATFDFIQNCSEKNAGSINFSLKPIITTPILTTITPELEPQNKTGNESQIMPTPLKEGHFHVIVGVFAKRENAQKQALELKNLGYASVIIRSYTGSKHEHVCAGIFNDQKSAQQMADILQKKHGIKAFIKKT